MNIVSQRNYKIVCSQNELADVVSIHMQYMLWTFIAKLRLHTFMSLHMLREVIFGAEFLLTNVIYEPSAFTVWLQQMYLYKSKSSEFLRTASTWVKLGTSVNKSIKLHICDCLKQLSTVSTVIWSYVAVYMSFMSLQVAVLAETFVTQWTLVWFIFSVDSHVRV